MNTNDLDDLFRRAAEKYPLRTDSSDWDKIERALNEDETSLTPPPVSFSDDNSRRRRLLWLLLLLPLAGIGYYSLHNRSSSLLQTVAVKQEVAKNKVAGEDKNDVQPAEPVNAPGAKSRKTMEESAGNDKPAIAVIVKDKNAREEKSNTKNQDERINGAIAGKINSINAIGFPSANVSKSSRLKTTDRYVSPFSANYNKQGTTGEQPGTENDNDIRKSNMNLAMDKVPIQGVLNFPADDKALNRSVTSFLPDNKNNAATAKGKPKKNVRSSFFYAGILVAPDISMVKFQSVKGTGYTAGVLFGYSISPKISLESGIYYDSKKYYTQGEYFKKTSFLNYVDLLNVNGSCNMIEVPVNFRYNIFAGKKSNWFATTGLSTYFMFKEAYNYKYVYNGTMGNAYYTYHNGSQNWFSVLNLSAGYEHTIGNIGSLRIEPYLRIPLSGMGTGSLPIMSTGLNIGITRRIK